MWGSSRTTGAGKRAVDQLYRWLFHVLRHHIDLRGQLNEDESDIAAGATATTGASVGTYLGGQGGGDDVDDGDHGAAGHDLRLSDREEESETTDAPLLSMASEEEHQAGSESSNEMWPGGEAGQGAEEEEGGGEVQEGGEEDEVDMQAWRTTDLLSHVPPGTWSTNNTQHATRC